MSDQTHRLSFAMIRERCQQLLNDFTHLRFYRVSIVHWIMLFIWVALLLCFTSVYRKLYDASALFATMCTNILLFGISDILAQSIHCYLSYTVDPVPQVIDSTARNIMNRIRGDSVTDRDTESGYESDNLSVFNDYGISPTPTDEIYHSEYDDAPETHIFDFYRWICFMSWGFILSFFQVPWYKFLNYFYTEDPTVVQVLERVLSDQLLYSPVSLYCFFMYSNYIMEGGDAETFGKKIQRLYISTLGCNYLVWPTVQFINFLVVPKHFQVPFSSSVGILWNCFLSMRNASSSALKD